MENLLNATLQRRMKRKICLTPYCRNKIKKGNYCQTCYRKRWAAKNPVKYAYQVLKYNARRRGKIFDLTYEQFAAFCYKNEYIAKKGRGAESLTIDRVRQAEGYTADNIQPLTNRDNVVKAWRELVYDRRTKQAYVVTRTETITNIENPF